MKRKEIIFNDNRAHVLEPWNGRRDVLQGKAEIFPDVLDETGKTFFVMVTNYKDGEKTNSAAPGWLADYVYDEEAGIDVMERKTTKDGYILQVTTPSFGALVLQVSEAISDLYDTAVKIQAPGYTKSRPERV